MWWPKSKQEWFNVHVVRWDKHYFPLRSSYRNTAASKFSNWHDFKWPPNITRESFQYTGLYYLNENKYLIYLFCQIIKTIRILFKKIKIYIWRCAAYEQRLLWPIVSYYMTRINIKMMIVLILWKEQEHCSESERCHLNKMKVLKCAVFYPNL